MKKVLALEAEVKNSHAALSTRTKEASSLSAELEKYKTELAKSEEKVKAMEVNAKEFAALKEKVKEVSQVNEDLQHQLGIKNDALQKAIAAAKAAESRATKAQEAIKAEAEKAVLAYTQSEAHKKAMDDAVEDFKSSVAGEQYRLMVIEEWQESEDGRYNKVFNFNLGFEDFRKAAKNRYPELDLSLVCMEDLFPTPVEVDASTVMETSADVDVEGGEEVSKPDGESVLQVTEPSPTPNLSSNPVEIPPSTETMTEATSAAVVSTRSGVADPPVDVQDVNLVLTSSTAGDSVVASDLGKETFGSTSAPK